MIATAVLLCLSSSVAAVRHVIPGEASWRKAPAKGDAPLSNFIQEAVVDKNLREDEPFRDVRTRPAKHSVDGLVRTMPSSPLDDNDVNVGAEKSDESAAKMTSAA